MAGALRGMRAGRGIRLLPCYGGVGRLSRRLGQAKESAQLALSTRQPSLCNRARRLHVCGAYALFWLAIYFEECGGAVIA